MISKKPIKQTEIDNNSLILLLGILSGKMDEIITLLQSIEKNTKKRNTTQSSLSDKSGNDK